jgi:hypothetical protein
MRISIAAVMVAALSFALLGRTQASPTPVPGGANQSAGLSGLITGELFNGNCGYAKCR